MNIDIKALSPTLLADYLHFFDHVAFADHADWAQCYCIHFHWKSEWDNEPPRSNRDRVVECINNGIIRGYLAYVDGQVAGWCNANDKHAYSGLAERGELWEGNEDGCREKAVVCFLVAPDMRGKGIASALLAKACVDAAVEGYDYMEVYPPLGACDMYAAHHGTVSMCRRMGFVEHGTYTHDVRMRKRLSVVG